MLIVMFVRVCVFGCACAFGWQKDDYDWYADAADVDMDAEKRNRPGQRAR